MWRQPVLAQFLGGDGDVFIATAGGERKLVVAGATIPDDATVETADDATALIALLPNVAVQLNGGSAITIEHAAIAKNGNAMTFPVRARAAGVRLLRGSLTASTPPGFTQAELRVYFAGGTVVVAERTAIYLDHAHGRTRVTNVGGQVRIGPAAADVEASLPAGYYADLDASGRLIGEPRLIVVDEAAAEQSAAASETQELVAEVTERLASAPPPWRRQAGR